MKLVPILIIFALIAYVKSDLSATCPDPSVLSARNFLQCISDSRSGNENELNLMSALKAKYSTMLNGQLKYQINNLCTANRVSFDYPCGFFERHTVELFP